MQRFIHNHTNLESELLEFHLILSKNDLTFRSDSVMSKIIEITSNLKNIYY
jgi:hypothetical protein